MSTEVLQGTLDLMVLRTLDTMGPQHGFGLAKRILQISEGILDLNQGTLYPALLRLEQRRWIRSKWGTSDNNRKAKFYELTARGRRQIAQATENWTDTVSLMDRFLRASSSSSGDR
jgi:PadR family transcriptional regulator PadR